MQRELEVKILDMDFEELKKKVQNLGAEKISEENQINLRINSSKHPIDPDLGYLRVRLSKKGKGKTEKELTFKARDKAKLVRNYSEFTTNFTDEESLLAILEILGYDQVERGEKHRESYRYKNVRFDFDTWDKDSYPHPYMEIEVQEEEDLEEITKILEIPKENISKKSIAELRADLGLE